MTGASLFKEVPSPDDLRLSQIQKNLVDAFDVVSAAIAALAIPVLGLALSTALPSGRAVVVFSGNAGQTLTLARAQAQGSAVASLVVIANTSSVNVSIKAAGGDTLNGAIAAVVLAAGGFLLLVSDGAKRWISK